MQRSPPVHRRGSGACPDTRRFNKPCATTISTHSVCPDSTSPPKLNPVEPPWYGPVCPVVGEGWHREVYPYPDQSALRRLHLDLHSISVIPGLAAERFLLGSIRGLQGQAQGHRITIAVESLSERIIGIGHEIGHLDHDPAWTADVAHLRPDPISRGVKG